MPRKLSKSETWPTLVLDRITAWGKCIATQRRRQRITAADLSTRLGILRMTLSRLERGDPGASVGSYLTALLVLGIFDQAVPTLPVELWQGEYGQRVKPTMQEKGAYDAEYF